MNDVARQDVDFRFDIFGSNCRLLWAISLIFDFESWRFATPLSFFVHCSLSKDMQQIYRMVGEGYPLMSSALTACGLPNLLAWADFLNFVSFAFLRVTGYTGC
jgi:hypothetical protein